MSNDSTAYIVGIDLGTTYSCIGMWIDSKVQIFSNETGNRTTPSVIAFLGKERLVGDAAKNQSIFNPTQVVYDSKRMLGKNFDDKTIQGDLSSWPFKVIKGEKKTIKVVVEVDGKTREFSPEQISSMVLIKMKEIAQSFLQREVKDSVITVPAYFNDGQRLATKDAGALASLNVIRIVNEPTAACIAYGMDRLKRGSSSMKKERSVLIFDLGGGTFDVSILCIDSGVFEVKATHGNTHLGGEDFDRALTDTFIEEFETKHPSVAIRKDPRAYRRLKSALERAKRTVSSRMSTQIELDALIQGIDYSFVLTRSRFEQICEPLFKLLIKPIQDCVIDAGYGKKKIHDIVLVGGSTRIPAIKKLLQDQFKGRHISNNINPDEAVAYGAAIQGAILSGLEDDTVNNLLLLDVIPLSLGVETEGKYNEIVVPKNSTIPTTRIQYFCAATDFQDGIIIKVVEGERPNIKDCHELGQFSIKVRPCKQKDSKIGVNFDIDADGLLEVTANDFNSKAKNKLTITSDRRILTKEEVSKMIEEAAQHEEDDKDYKELITKKLELRKALRDANSMFPDPESFSKITPPERAKAFEKFMYELNIWSDSDVSTDISEWDLKIKQLKEKLNNILSKLDDPEYLNDPNNVRELK